MVDNSSTYDSLRSRVAELRSQGKYSEAIPIAEKAVQAAKNEFGEKHPDYAQSLNNLAMLYESMGPVRGGVPARIRGKLKSVVFTIVFMYICARSIVSISLFIEALVHHIPVKLAMGTLCANMGYSALLVCLFGFLVKRWKSFILAAFLLLVGIILSNIQRQ